MCLEPDRNKESLIEKLTSMAEAQEFTQLYVAEIADYLKHSTPGSPRALEILGEMYEDEEWDELLVDEIVHYLRKSELHLRF